MTYSLNVPYLDYDDIRKRADDFLKEYNPDGIIPVAMEEIVEFQLGINIIPIHGLHKAYEIDGFHSSDLQDISVDEYVYESRPGRYRFTLAHEVGHIVMHKYIYDGITFNNIMEWKEFVRNIPEQEYGRLEYQAYCFAGLVLVPSIPLHDEFMKAKEMAKSFGVDLKKSGDIAMSYMEQFISKAFLVSAEVVHRRIEYDKLEL